MDVLTKRFFLIAGATATFCFGSYHFFFAPETTVAQMAKAAQVQPTSSTSGASSAKSNAVQTKATQVAAADKKTEAQPKSQQSESAPFSCAIEDVSQPAAITGPMGKLQGPFLVVKMTLTGKRSASFDVNESGIQAEDANGNLYKPNFDAMGTLMQKGFDTFHLKQIDPGVPTTAYVAFKFPKNAKLKAIHIRPHGMNEHDWMVTL